MTDTPLTRTTPGGLVYLCVEHNVYTAPPRHFVRWHNGRPLWSRDPSGPFVEDHTRCQLPNTWSDEP